MEMTLGRLAKELALLVEKYPEYADCKVFHASECGFSTASFYTPLTIAVPTYTPEFQTDRLHIRLVSDDDGYEINRAVSEWNFYNKYGEEKMEDLRWVRK